MDDHTNDRDSGLPPGGSPEELEEALKWLEELTARQGKPAELSNPVPPASLDSPFRGLIDSDEGDLPDWLREVPTPPGSQEIGNGEPESRLDWLAKMAQRESIEELPTLEWRRLSEPVQSAILANHQTDIEPSMPEDADQLDELVELPAETAAEEPVSTASEIVEGIAELPPAETPQTDEWVESLAEFSESDAEVAPVAEGMAVELEGDAVVLDGGELEPSTTNWETDERLSTLDNDELPPLDDLDAAMAWIEELAVSQEGPIEEIPSVADRALASKLMAEAGLPASMSTLDEIGSDSELIDGLTPTHPFIEEEDFADTVVLVETLAADEGRALSHEADFNESAATQLPDEAAVGSSFDEEQTKSVTDDLGEITTFDEASAPSPHDDIEFPESDMPEETELGEVEELTSEPSLPEDFPVDSSDEALSAEAEEFVGDEAAWETAYELSADELSFEEAMAYLDEMAVQPVETGDGDSQRLDAEDIAATAIVASVTASEDGTVAEDEIGEPEIEDAEIVAITESLVADSDESDAELSGPDEFESISDDYEPIELESLPVESPNGFADLALEEALASLDALALPPGRSLDEIDLTLRTAQVTPWRDVNSALDWLESNLAIQSPPAPVPPAVLDEEALIAQMPEDPDAVLAWLEQLAADEEEPSEAYEAMVQPVEDAELRGEPLIEELAEADLLNMPDDPDEAMLWLEGLARDGRPGNETVPPSEVETIVPIEPAMLTEIDAADGEIMPSGEVVEPVEPALTEEELHEALAESAAAGLVYEQPEEDISLGEQEDEDVNSPVDEVEGFVTNSTDEPPPSEVENTAANVTETQPEPLPQEAGAPANRRRRKPAKPKDEPTPAPEEPDPSEPDTLSWVDLLKPLD